MASAPKPKAKVRPMDRTRPAAATQVAAQPLYQRPVQPAAQPTASVAQAPPKSKGFTIAVIVIIAIIALAGLMFFFNKSAGHAFFGTGPQDAVENTAGIAEVDAVPAQSDITLLVKAKTAESTVALGFELALPSSLRCADWREDMSFSTMGGGISGWTSSESLVIFNPLHCVDTEQGSVIRFKQGVLNPEEAVGGTDQPFDVATIVMRRQHEGEYTFHFNSFEVYDLSMDPVDLITNEDDMDAVIEVVQCVQDSDCGESGPCVDSTCEGGLFENDDDRDGVTNDVDECADTGSEIIVASNGCPQRDQDLDGIPDEDDECPEVPNPNGVSCEAGALADRDGDSVPDLDDNCPGLDNTEQEDVDADGLGDACDHDLDADICSAEQAELCETQEDCEGADLIWAEDACSNPLNPWRCDDIPAVECVYELDCTHAGNFWYDESCHADEDVVDCLEHPEQCLPEVDCMDDEGNLVACPSSNNKISVRALPRSGSVYLTEITALEDINTPFQVFTTLVGPNGNVVFESRNIASMTAGQKIVIRTDSLGKAVTQKRVVIYDTPDTSQWTIHLDEPLVTNYDNAAVAQ